MRPFTVDLVTRGVTLDLPHGDTLFAQQKVFLKSAILDQMESAGLRVPTSIVIGRHRLRASALDLALEYTSQQGHIYNVTAIFDGDAEEMVEQAFEFASQLLAHVRTS